MMRKCLFLTMIALLITGATSYGQPRDVFFAGGQSNARPEWANAIQASLASSGEFHDPLVIHAYHPGASLAAWWENDVAQANYEADFLNASDTGVLQAALQGIVAAGGEYNFRGFFWFQGESDSYPASVETYYDTFTGMLEQLESDLGCSESIDFCLAVIDMNPASWYDDPEHVYGITRADVEGVRNVQFALASLPNGSCVDTRGCFRTDAFHLDVDGLTSVGLLMGQEYIANIPEPTSIAICSLGILGLIRRN